VNATAEKCGLKSRSEKKLDDKVDKSTSISILLLKELLELLELLELPELLDVVELLGVVELSVFIAISKYFY
jgi:hypothetical protein